MSFGIFATFSLSCSTCQEYDRELQALHASLNEERQRTRDSQSKVDLLKGELAECEHAQT